MANQGITSYTLKRDNIIGQATCKKIKEGGTLTLVQLQNFANYLTVSPETFWNTPRKMNPSLDARLWICYSKEKELSRMLDQNDLLAIAKLMDAKLEPINARLDKIEEEARHTRVLIENQDHKINLIAQQHSEIIEKLSVTKEVDSLKGRMSTLECTVKTHTAQITDLKKAQ